MWGAVKKRAILPTLMTLGNAVCGFAAIACAGKTDQNVGFFALSGWLIILAMVFDSLDGYVARLSRSASHFGLELDSLCDAISFGLAPAFLLLRLGPGWSPQPRLHEVLAVVAALYMVCAILRLARFNVEAISDSGKKTFRGLPSPAAAGCMASLAILRGGESLAWVEPGFLHGLVEVWATLGGLFVALLMVSRVPYPHLTKKLLRGRRPFSHLVQVIFAGGLILLVRDVAVAVLFWVYALFFAVRYLWVRGFHPEMLASPAPGLDEPLPH
jgi:CDP-diacylglycerol--serine O-phosphatidyltransferase